MARRNIPRQEPPDDLVQTVVDAYLKMTDAQPNLRKALAFSSYLGKLEMMGMKLLSAPGIVVDKNTWGGTAYRHDDLAICAMRAKALGKKKEEKPEWEGEIKPDDLQDS